MNAPLLDVAETARGDNWRYRAACQTSHSELFFPANEDNELYVAPARMICWRCPVAADCLAFAVGSRQRHGVWGGLTTSEREQLSGHRWRRQA